MDAAPPSIEVARLATWRARLAVCVDACRDRLDADAPDARLIECIAALRTLRTRLRLVNAGLQDSARVHEFLATVRDRTAAVETSVDVEPLLDELHRLLPPSTAERREFYVYLHCATDGRVFYVGKGRGRRAWSRARTAVWHRYVEERLAGRYEVRVHRDGLTHAEALALEADLIRAHGPALLNWQNPARDVDAGTVERARLLRADALARVGVAAFFETSAPEEALRRYRLALADVRVYAHMPVERGLLGELKDANRCGDPIVLDRLTRCLARLGRDAELVSIARAYFAEFPDAAATSAGRRVVRRCERAAAARMTRPHAPPAAGTSRSRVLR